MLTDKAKKDFTKWLEKYHHLNGWRDYDEVELPSLLMNALIVEWFDSVGIHIIITEFDGDNFWAEFEGLGYSEIQPTRNEVLKAIIETANIKYNE